MDENRIMPPAIAIMLALGVLATATAAPPLPRGSAGFQLGMLRAQVDSAVAARRLPVLSDASAYLVCGSDDPQVEYEQYSFFQAPHGMKLLWKVTIGYHPGTSRGELDTVLTQLRGRLGDPASDTEATTESGVPTTDARPAARQVIWADPLTIIQLGGRWDDEQVRSADRMMVTWTDRRLQRLIEARRRQGRPKGGD
jgi:hypothetical protein